MSHPPVFRLLAVAGLLFAAGCGDDDAASAPETPPVEDAVRVAAQDIGFGADQYEVEAGEVAFEYVNEGNILHTLVIEDVGGLELTVRSTGDTDRGSVGLETGEYVLYCDVAGHRQAGMEATLVVS